MKNRKYFVVYVADIANKETNCKEKDYIENIIVEANDVGGNTQKILLILS